MAAQGIDPEARPDRARAVRGLRVAAYGLIVVLAVGAAAWLAIGGEGGGGRPPVILAESTPERLPPDPDKPNGEVVPHQDEVVYEVVGGDSMTETEERGLAPAPEAPLPKPEPETPRADAPPPVDGPVQLLPPDPEPDRIGGPTLPSAVTVPEQAPPPAPETAEAPPPEAAPPAPAETAPRSVTRANLPPESETPPAETMAKTEPAAPDAPPQAKPPEPAAEAPKPEAPTPEPPKPEPPKPVAEKPEPAKPAPAKENALASLPPEGAYRIQLGAVRDRETAQSEWRRLRQRYPDILGGLQLYIQQVTIAGKGEFHRIQAGPLPEKIVAELACDQLNARKAPCFVVAK